MCYNGWYLKLRKSGTYGVSQAVLTWKQVKCLQGASSEQNVNTGSTEPVEGKKSNSSVGLRWLTAAIGMPIVLLFVWFGGWAAFAAILLIIVLGTFELHAMLRHIGYHPLIWISLGLCVVFLLSAMFPSQRLLLLEIGLGACLPASFVWIFFRRQKLEGALVDWALTLAIAVYLGWPMSYFLLIRGYEPGMLHLSERTWLSLPPGVWWLLVTLLGVWGFDASAFFAGRYFGRHKLAPTISPAKTWEGVIGGMMLSITASLVLTVLPLGVPWYLAILLGILIGAAGTIGDLAESLIKRQTRVKDSGQIIPGHGGMLDRVDSLLFAVMVVYFFSLFFVR